MRPTHIPSGSLSVFRPRALASLPPYFRRWTRLRTHARTSTTTPVSFTTTSHSPYPHVCPDGGWLKSNPIPSDKGKFGHFEEIALQNKRLLQQILSEDSSSHFSEASSLMASNPYDEQLLKKLRGLYQSCLDEDYLNEVGEAPLKELTQKIREVFRGKTTVVDTLKSKSEQERDRLTAAVAYLHSRGEWTSFGSDMESHGSLIIV